MKKINFTMLILFFLSGFCYAQFDIISQNLNSPLVAPSFAGLGGTPRIISNYRTVSSKFPGKHNLINLSFDFYVPILKSGFAFKFNKEDLAENTISNKQMGVAYTFNIKLCKNSFLRPAIGFFIEGFEFNYDNLIFNDQINLAGDHAIVSIEPHYTEFLTRFDSEASVLFHSDKVWVLMNARRIFPKYGDFTQDRKIYKEYIEYDLSCGYKWNIRESIEPNKGISLLFYGTFRKLGAFKQIELRTDVNYHQVLFGCGVRGNPFFDNGYSSEQKADAIIMKFGYIVSNLRIGYSYDFPTSGILSYHELSLSYYFRKNDKIIVEE